MVGMKLTRLAWIALAALTVAAGSASAQTEPPVPADQGDAATSENVVVSAPSLREMVREFVGEVSEAGQLDQLGRWDRTICPGVAGMRQHYAQVLIDRLAQNLIDRSFPGYAKANRPA